MIADSGPLGQSVRQNHITRGTFYLLVLLILTGSSGMAAAQGAVQVDLSVSLPSPQPVGTPVTLTAAVSGMTFPASYQFSVRPLGGAWRIVRDFNLYNLFEWSTLEEGWYEIRVVAGNAVDAVLAEDRMFYLITTRTIFGIPTVNETSHPLVALYSAPPCLGGGVRIAFRAAGSLFWQRTPVKPCRPGKSVNFYIGGMHPDSLYYLRQERVLGLSSSSGPTLGFQTGSLSMTLHNFEVSDPPDAATSLQDGILLSTWVFGDVDKALHVATDLAGNPVWYYEIPSGISQIGSALVRPVEGGTFLLIMRDQAFEGQSLREVDLAGNTVRETHARRVSRQLIAMGQDPMGSFHHEAVRLPNGHTLAIASVERVLTDVQGPGDVLVYGEMVIDLDENFQVNWAWNSFDHLDPARAAILGETCESEGPGCPTLFTGSLANDWLHANAINYQPEDGNITLSLRHQDWVIKIDYQDGAGSGNVLWRLGPNGDFTLTNGDFWDWFTHQHDSRLSNGELIVYDNGNTRVDLGPGGNSRGQVYQLDEVNMTATLVKNFDLGNYSFALGSAQWLRNGNYHFLNGFLHREDGSAFFESIEVTPAGVETFVFTGDEGVYRSHRMQDMYTP